MRSLVDMFLNLIHCVYDDAIIRILHHLGGKCSSLTIIMFKSGCDNYSSWKFSICTIIYYYYYAYIHTKVKHRIAVGLSKEGWAITRNLLTLASMIVLGIATLNYAMKEFCIIALVGLICDFFLQLVFFPTVLAIDLRRLEVRMIIVHVHVRSVQCNEGNTKTV